MAAGPEIAASQAMDELNRQIAALALENTRLAHEHARLSGELGRLGDDLVQSRDYQNAISELLAIISRSASASDIGPVLDTMLAAAVRLCGVKTAAVAIRQGGSFRYVSTLGHSPEFDQLLRAHEFMPDEATVTGRVLLTRQVVHVDDMAADLEHSLLESVTLGGMRTALGVPLLRDGSPIGVIMLNRNRVEPFTEHQIALVRTFADQAVIAMENARLLGELSESLDRQTATSEILQVINASPSDLAPVFEAMLERAVQLSASAFGMMNVWQDGRFRTVALRGVPPGLMERWVDAPAPGPRNALSRIVVGEDVVHIEDLTDYESYRLGDARTHALVETGGARSLLAVALRKDGVLLGVLTAYRQEVRPFTDKQIALLQSFAAQAVIAMENARLINETREALQRQTATTEILEVINASPGSLAPVFDTILAKATALCEAEFGILWLYKDGFIRAAAHFNVPPAYAEFLGQGAHRVNPINAHGRLLGGEAVVHISDIMADEAYVAGDPLRRALVELGGGRAQITVPLRKEGAFLGDFVVYRKVPGPFSNKHIALLQGFAQQAVIAMDNARLLGELRESLDQQTATSDVLRTISRSSTDLAEVLDTLLAAVARLCRADQAYMFRRHGELHRLVAAHGVSAEGEAFIRSHPFRHERGTTSGRVAVEKRVVHIHDVLTDPEYTYNEGQRNAGFRTMLGLPLLKEDTLVGVFVLSRTAVDPFSPREIELASGFADQAVVAIENARLFEELSDRQAELRVTLDNTGDGVVMFDADFRLASWNRNFQEMLDVSDAFVAGRPGYDDYLRLLVGRGELGDGDPAAIVAGHRERASRPWSAERTRPDGRIIEVRNNPVPDGGAVLIYSDITERKRAEAQIAAARDAAEEALEQQTATAEILRAISQSPTDVQPVLDAVVKAAVRFCGATDAVIALREGDGAAFVAHEGPIIMALGASLPMNRQSAGGRAIVDGRTCHFPDIASLDPVEFAAAHQFSRDHGFRAIVAAPLLRNNAAIGAVILRKTEAGPFTSRQIELLETFAAQAVIAIENVRLFTELSESLEQQTATADILKAIASSPTDVQPVLDAVVKAALRFCGAPDALIVLRDGDVALYAAHEGPIEARRGPRRLSRQTAPGRAMVDGKVVQIADLQSAEGDDFQEGRALGAAAGFRSALAAPLLRDDVAIGAISLRRPEAGGFTPNQVELLKSFAAQAVIAIENVRLFTELRDSLEQQTATADILKAIASSPTDVAPVLDAVAKAALRFCGAPDAVVWLRDGDDNVVAAHQGTLTASLGMRRPMATATFSGQAMLEGRTRQFADVDDLDPAVYGDVLALARQHKWRASAAAPMMHGGKAIGCVVLRKPEPGLLSPRQIALLETFAAQAVIAIENVRLFTELRDALEQQTATAEILRAISRSPTDVAPVLEAVTSAALRFCGAPDALVMLRDGDETVVAAHEGSLTATLGLRRPITANFSGQALLEGRTVQIANVDELEADRYPEVLALARQHGWRSSVTAPMMHGGKAIGCVVLRKPEPGLLSPRQIALLETFAAQAVIAIENVRLFTELRDSLEQQTATAEILRVISQSPTDVNPVLAAVAKAALKFCSARDAQVGLRNGDHWIVAASEGPIGVVPGPRPLNRHTTPGRAMLDGKVVQITDFQSSEADGFPEARNHAARLGVRSALAAPLLRDDVAIGAISLRRPEPGAYTPNQVELLKSFAAQAVIAIENVRLFTELRETLDQQTASAEILRVISQSPTDVQPVLDAIAESAVHLCAGEICAVYRFDGTLQHLAAHYRVAPEVLARLQQRYPHEPYPDTATGRAILDRTVIHLADIVDDPRFPGSQNITAGAGYRAVLAVPMMQDEQPIGVIFVVRLEATPFSDKQIELLRTFAAQAVIAIQNVRLFTELRESLERLRAAQANLIQSEKMASLGQLTAGIAHEIKNPLNFVNNFAVLSVDLLDELKETAGEALATLDETKRAAVDETIELLVSNLDKIAEHGKRADGIVKSMLSHSRGGSGEWTPSDINALVEEALNLAYHGARAQDNEFNVTLERDFVATPRPIEVVPQDVTRVFLNLFGNGFYAVGKRRRADKLAGFRPTLKVSTRDLGEAVEVRVRDNGTGIPPDVRQKLFQPFFTTKPTGEGTGLGLSISYDIVTQQHGGTIEVESEPGRFTEFTVRLPRRRVQTSERA